MKDKKDSYMNDVKIIKKIDDMPKLKEKLIEAFDAKAADHKAISRCSLLLAEHILNLAGIPRSGAIEECFTVNERWQRGQAKF